MSQFWAIFPAQVCAGESRFLVPNKDIRKSEDTDLSEWKEHSHSSKNPSSLCCLLKYEEKAEQWETFSPEILLSAVDSFSFSHSELNCSFSPHIHSSQLERPSKLRETSAKPYSFVQTRRHILPAPPSASSPTPCLLEHLRQPSLFLEVSPW